MTFALWANAIDAPTSVCRDARLTDAPSELAYPRGTTRGQAGWHIGLRFRNLGELANLVYRVRPHDDLCELDGVSGWFDDCATLRRGDVHRLAICAHGLPGRIFVEGQGAANVLSVDTFGRHQANLHRIGLITRTTATVLIMGCLAGQGREGTALLRQLSRLWPGRKVVAFSTVGYVAGGEMMRSGGEYCTEPGMRDTRSPSPSLGPAAGDPWAQHWRDLAAMPWASETSPGAKVVRNGEVLRGGDL